ncbi:hypothetical protein [Proteus faecis]|uniref:hypothetical protein n=1 Tax=Proteus faecis TaxID=2050967 RepID=UPI003CE97E58
MEIAIEGYKFEISFTQIITWSIAIIAIICSITCAFYFFRKSSRNTWIGNINDEIENLENEAILFWTSKNNSNDIQDIGKLTRKIKKITTLARDINKYGGCKYPESIFIRLRRAVTHEEYKNNRLKKSESPDSYRNMEIKTCCEELRDKYKR